MSTACCAHPRENDLEDELAIAEGARAQGDWKHALHHYLGALGMDGLSEQAIAAVRRLHAEHDLLTILAEDHYAGAHLARAYLLADKGEHEEAIAIVAQIDDAMPQLGCVKLLLDWLDHVPAESDARNWAVRRLAGASSVGMGRLSLLPGERAAIAPYADLGRKVARHVKERAVLGAVAGILRRAGRADEAIAMLGDGEPQPWAFVALGLAHRAAKNPERGAAMFAKVFELTGEPIYLLEQARALGDAKKWREAIALAKRFQDATQSEPDRELQIFLDWLDGCARGDAGALARDYDWVRRTALLQGAIIAPGDATTNMLADPRVKRGSKVKVGVSALESPSVRLALAIHAGEGPDPRKADYAFSAVPTPDPRVPRGKPKTVLWIEEDGVMVQNVAAPPDEVRALVAECARAWSDLFVAWDGAAGLVKGSPDDVAAAMVHPGDPPEGFPTAEWIFRWQIACAFLIARSESGWRGTKRRQLLLDLVRGPVDWTTSAALHALGEIAVHEPDALPEIRRELTLLGKAVPQGGHCCYGQSLAIAASKIPFFPPDVAQRLTEDWFGGGGGEEEAEEKVEQPALPSDAKRPWWRFW